MFWHLGIGEVKEVSTCRVTEGKIWPVAIFLEVTKKLY